MRRHRARLLVPLAALPLLVGCPIVDDISPPVPGVGASAAPGAAASPGAGPLVRPSGRPSAAPGAEPGDEPTEEPTDEPADDPADEPGEEPGEEPGDEPSAAPAGVPAGGVPTVEVIASGLETPEDVALAPDGTIYVADTFAHVVRRIGPDGDASIVAGAAGEPGLADGVGAAARLGFPNSIAVDPRGTLLVREGSGGNNTIRAISPAGKVVTLAGRGEQPDGTTASLIPGEPSKVRLGGREGIALVAGGALVADAEEDRIVLLLQDGTVEVFAGGGGEGLVDGQGAAARFDTPAGVATDAAGNVYVADFGNDAIRKISSTGRVTTLYQAEGDELFEPTGIAVDAAGNVYVSDSNPVYAAGEGATFGRIQRLSPDGVLSLVYDATKPDAAGQEYAFDIAGFEIAADGSIVFADQEGDRIVRLRFAGE